MTKDRTFFTPQNIDHFLQCLRKGLTMKAACDETGFTKHQIRHFRTKNHTFDQQIKEAIKESTEPLEDRLRKLIGLAPSENPPRSRSR